MIVPYKPAHLKNFWPNDYSIPPESSIEQALSAPGFCYFTILNDQGIPQIIFGAICYYALSFYVHAFYAKKVDVSCLKDFREFIHGAGELFGIRRIETESVAIESVSRVHRFLGFEQEGVKRKKIGDMDYICWGRVWE